MANSRQLPQRVSALLPLDRDHIVDYRQLRLVERRALSAFQVMAFRGRHAAAAAAIGAALGLEVSTLPGASVRRGAIEVDWNGPNSWMVICAGEEGGHEPGEMLGRLQTALGDLGAVVDQSHGRCALRLSGLRAREVLAKLSAIDLHPRVFGTGRCALTSVAHINVTVVQVDDTPTFDLRVNRSLARSFAQAVEHACAEFARD